MNHQIQLIESISFLFEIYQFLWINWLNKAYLNPKTIKRRRSIIINKRYKLIIFFLIWIIFNRHGLKFYYDEIINEHLLKKMLHVTHFVLFFFFTKHVIRFSLFNDNPKKYLEKMIFRFLLITNQTWSSSIML